MHSNFVAHVRGQVRAYGDTRKEVEPSVRRLRARHRLADPNQQPKDSGDTAR